MVLRVFTFCSITQGFAAITKVVVMGRELEWCNWSDKWSDKFVFRLPIKNLLQKSYTNALAELVGQCFF